MSFNDVFTDTHNSPISQDAPDMHQEHQGEEPWLVSYADLMTLLFGFFAMLFTFASFQEDKEDYIKVRKDIAKYFGGTHVTAPEKLTGAVNNELKKNPALKEVLVNPKDDGLEINLLSNTLFVSGKAEMIAESLNPLSRLAEVITATSKEAVVTVEGHCDDNPIHDSIFPSNWELSAARAAAIVRIFERVGIPAMQLGAIGYGDTRPAFPNRDTAGRPIPDNQTLNRRVVIKVSLPSKGAKKEELYNTPANKDSYPNSTPPVAVPPPAQEVTIPRK